jgi:tetratricopeptide (TPR) repeat protein
VDLADAIQQARELQDQQRYDEAIQILLKAAGEHEDEDLWFEIAAFYADRGFRRPDALALADFDEADKWADLPVSRLGRAGILARRGEFEPGEALVKEVLEADPEFAGAYGALAQVRLLQKRYGEAIDVLAKALELNPRYAEAYALLAEALRAEGKLDLARTALADGAKRCPGHEGLLVSLAHSYMEAEDFAKARRALDQAVTLNSENVEAWRLLGWIAAKDGDELRMSESLDRAAALDPDATMAWVTREAEKLPALGAFLK